MAKGDSSRSQNQINNQGTTAQDSQNALMNTLYGQNQGFGNNYNAGTNLNFGDYNQGQTNYGNLYNALSTGQTGVGINSSLPQQGNGQFSLPQGMSPTDPQAESAYVQYLSQQPGADPTLATDPNYWIGKINDTGGVTPGNEGYWNNRSLAGAGNSNNSSPNNAIGGANDLFNSFTQNGGFSPQDIQDMRNRAASTMRATYGNAQNNLNQNRELQQFSPNYDAATASLTRNLGYGLSNAETATNATLANMIQQGKLSGAQGLLGVQGINNSAQQNNISDMLAGLSGSTSLYGATPGLANTFGNQYLNSSGQLGSGNQNQTNLGLGLIQGQNYKGANVAGDLQQGINNFGNVLKPVSGALVGAYGAGGWA